MTARGEPTTKAVIARDRDADFLAEGSVNQEPLVSREVDPPKDAAREALNSLSDQLGNPALEFGDDVTIEQALVNLAARWIKEMREERYTPAPSADRRDAERYRMARKKLMLDVADEIQIDRAVQAIARDAQNARKGEDHG